MINVVVVGAAGRMGKRLVTLITESNDLKLFGAVEYAGCPLLGEDATAIAGLSPSGVLLTDSLADALQGADAVIDFSTADIVNHAQVAVANDVAMVIGTTGLDDASKKAIGELAQSGKIVLATNMSVGVNLLFHLVKEVAQRLDDQYDIEIIEMHHNQKKDSPSGTAVTLLEKVAEARGLDIERDTRHGRVGLVGSRTRQEIGMHAVRGGDVVGDHTVIFASNGERIELTHKASNRDAFATGALKAVRFLCASDCAKGLYNMQDVLNLN